MCNACTRDTRTALIAMLTLASIPPFPVHDGTVVRDLNAERDLMVRLLETFALGIEDESPEHVAARRAISIEIGALPIRTLNSLANFATRTAAMVEQMHRIFGVQMAEHAMNGNEDARAILTGDEAFAILAEGERYKKMIEGERREQASLN